jgi:hypothetical protein
MTILLPAWKDLLGGLKMSIRNIPRDVATRWNSTFDMLDFALEYQKAIKSMVSDPDHGLSQYAMSAQEWKIIAQLRDVLKVSHNRDICFAGTPSASNGMRNHQSILRRICSAGTHSSNGARNCHVIWCSDHFASILSVLRLFCIESVSLALAAPATVRKIATSSGASTILRRNSSSDVYHAFAQHLRHNATNG